MIDFLFIIFKTLFSLFSCSCKTSVLYRMKKMNSANTENPRNIINKGMSIDGCMAGDSVSLILAG